MKSVYYFQKNFRSFLLAAILLLVAFTSRAADPFFFIQLSDPQFGMYAENANFVQETANFEFVVASINRLHPAFVVITGDLINKAGDVAQLAEYKRLLAKVDSTIPVYSVPGNHDVGNLPTPYTLSTYTNQLGPDHYVFHHGDFTGIVLDSNLIQAPQQTAEFAAEQEGWLKSELEKTKKANAQHIVLFQHHPWFLESATETNQYFNLPQKERAKYLPLFHEYGVKKIFCGHWHRNNSATDGDLEVVASAPVGKPLGKDPSGIRIVIVRDEGIEHRYYGLGEIPHKVELTKAK